MKPIAPEDSTIPSCEFPSDEEKQAALDRLSKPAFEYGLYDHNEMPEGCFDE